MRAREFTTENNKLQSWFGNSKVVNPDGTPMRMYHGTTRDFDKFLQTAKSNPSTDARVAKLGFFFTNSSAKAGRFAATVSKGDYRPRWGKGSRILPVYLSIQNPYVADAREIYSVDRKQLEAQGYDGIIFKDGSGTDEVVAFYPEQIRSIFDQTEQLTELRQSLDQYLKQQFPNWPDYVVRDLMYKNAKSFTSQEELQDWIDGIKYDYPVRQWRLQKLNITLDIFDKKTQSMIRARKGGSANPYGVPKDTERHATQQAMIQKQGVSQEPIIVFDHGDGKLELIEGWHRTIQNLQAYPQGYQGPAWVGYL